jgi:uncharacterized membrane protein YoaK (UPF0700 family)
MSNEKVLILIVIIVFCLGCGYFSYKIAEQKKYNPVVWFILGLLFNIVALIAIGFYEINPFPEDD